MNPVIRSRRARVATALPLGDGLLVIGAGDPIPLPEGSDQTYPFRSHAEYFYLASHECAGGVVAFDPRDGAAAGWKSFVPAVTEGERVWEGREQLPGTALAEFAGWLAARSGRPIAQLGAPVQGVAPNADLSTAVRDAFLHARRIKDAGEIALVRRATAATARGYQAIRDFIQPGRTERTLGCSPTRRYT